RRDGGGPGAAGDRQPRLERRPASGRPRFERQRGRLHGVVEPDSARLEPLTVGEAATRSPLHPATRITTPRRSSSRPSAAYCATSKTAASNDTSVVVTRTGNRPATG